MVWPVDVPAVSGHWKKKNPESHHIHIKKKMLSNSCLFVFLFKLISICASFQILLHIIPQSPSTDCCSPLSTLHSGFGVLFLSEFALINNTFNQWRLVTSFCTPFHLNRGVTPYQNPWRQDLSSCTVVHFLSSLEFPCLWQTGTALYLGMRGSWVTVRVEVKIVTSLKQTCSEFNATHWLLTAYKNVKLTGSGEFAGRAH